MAKVTIVGLSTVGTSIGLALAETLAADKSRRESLSIVGYDREFKRAEGARVRGAVGDVARSMAEAVGQADLVIIAQSALEVIQTLSEMASLLPSGCVVTDTADTKVEVLRAAEKVLPAAVYFVGGHPIPLPRQEVDWAAGGKAARADLFEGAIYCVIPARNVTEEAVETVRRLAQALGAAPFYLDSFEHDGLWAGVSQAPYVVAAAMLSTIGQSEAWRDLKLLADPTFRQLGELLASLPPESLQGCLTNRLTLVSWLDRLIAALVEVRREMAAPDCRGEALQKMVGGAQAALDDWARRRDDRQKELETGGTEAVRGARDQFLGMFVPQGLLRKKEQGDDKVTRR
jgi:prephenate dehydrogenase